MKKVLVLGATGTFGSKLTKKLLDETDYKLTLLSRHSKQIYNDNDRITALNKDATNYNDIREALFEQDVVYCAISGEKLPIVAQNLVKAMPEEGVNRIIFMGAVGIYNEIPEEMDGKDNVDNNLDQVPNRKAVDFIENSDLNYTIIRPGYLQKGDEDDFVLTMKNQKAKGYISTISSVLKLAVQLIKDDKLYSGESVSITKNME